MSTLTRQKTNTQLTEPPMYKVLLLNDDYTPMNFVVQVLQRFFAKSLEEAERIMLEGHERGVALAGVYAFEIAETKVTQVEMVSRQEGYPLKCGLEPT
ncbi:MAG: ATP-dependent Clp protease adapter ClpS [Deinococcales bacterium]